MSNAPLPSWCFLERLLPMRRDDAGDDKRVLPLTCVRKAAFGFDNDFQANALVKSLRLEAHLAITRLDLGYLTLQRDWPVSVSIHATDRNLLILETHFPSEALFHPLPVFLIYDALRKALFMIPDRPRNFSVDLTTRVLVARRHPDHDDGSYVLVMTGSKKEVVSQQGSAAVQWRDSIFLWSPFSPSKRPWEVTREASFQCLADRSKFHAAECFSFRGGCYWADLHCGIMHCTLEALLSSEGPVEFGFIDLPMESTAYLRLTRFRLPLPEFFRTIGVVNESSIKLVSIDGFIEHVDLEDRTITVWRLLLDDVGSSSSSRPRWEKEDELSLKTLWGLEGFNLPKNLTAMCPFLSPSTEDDNVVYFMLGDHRLDSKGMLIPQNGRYLLGVDMRNKILVTSIRLPNRFNRPAMHHLVSSDFTRYLAMPVVMQLLEKSSCGPPTLTEVGKHLGRKMDMETCALSVPYY